MKQEDTRQRILDEALELFSAKGYDSVSVGEIAKAVGIKAPSLYNHFPSKQAIFDAIVESTAAQYAADTDKIDIHVQDVQKDVPAFAEITEDALFEKVRQIFEYSLHDETISRFRRMMTIEQFRSPELAALYSNRYVERILQAIKKAGIWDDTIIIMTADHGGIKTGHGGKTLREMEIPFIISGKNVRKGMEIKESMMQYDTAAMIAYILGLKQPQSWIGRPVKTVFK